MILLLLLVTILKSTMQNTFIIIPIIIFYDILYDSFQFFGAGLLTNLLYKNPRLLPVSTTQ